MGGVLIVGPGAVGGVLAARWAETGLAVTLLGRTRASEERLSRGFSFIGRDGRRRRVRRGLRSARREGAIPHEVAFFCVKSHDTAAAARAARPWIGPATAVVGLQNGLGHERILRRAFGAKRTVMGSCYFAADRPAAGTVAYTGGNNILLAANDGNREALRKASSLLSRGGWKVGVKPSETRMLWTKLVFNAATNPLGALCAAPNGRLARDPALREIMLKVLGEGLAVARAEGRRPYYRDMAGLLIRSCRVTEHQKNSMLQDLQARRRTEAPAILGPLMTAGRRRRVPTPVMGMLDRAVRRLERLR